MTYNIKESHGIGPNRRVRTIASADTLADAIAHATPARFVVKRNADGGTYLARKDA